MTKEQEAHVVRLQVTFGKMLANKYRDGAQEHTGNIWDMTPLDLIDNAIAENIDQFTYLMTARDKISGMVIPGQHKPNNPEGIAMTGIECWRCWNQHQRITCIMSTGKADPSGPLTGDAAV